MATIDDLRTAYRDTYREYALKFGSFQRIRESKCASPNEFETAISELDRARADWNAARDRLACRYNSIDAVESKLSAGAPETRRATISAGN